MAALLALVAAVPAEAADGAKRKRCAVKGSKTVRSNDFVRVFYVKGSYGERVHYGCLRRTGRKRRLRTRYYEGFVNSVRLSRWYVAYEVFALTSSQSATTALARLNVRTRKDRTVAVLDRQYYSGSDLGCYDVGWTGAVVWSTVQWNYIGEHDTEAVRLDKLDRDGRDVLDPGPEVDECSLSMAPWGRRVYWTNDGRQRTARLR